MLTQRDIENIRKVEAIAKNADAVARSTKDRLREMETDHFASIYAAMRAGFLVLGVIAASVVIKRALR